MSSGTDIAAEIASALAEAGAATGSGPLVGTIQRKGARIGGTDYAPVYGPNVVHFFNVVLDEFDARERDGTAIEATDTKIIASVGSVVPSVSDKITVGGVVYAVYGVTPTNPGGVDLMFEIWARA